MTLTRSEAARLIGDKLIDMAHRVSVADKCSPGAVGQFPIGFADKQFDIMVRVKR